MRYVIGCLLALLLACGIAFTQDASTQDPSSLLELLAPEKALGHRHADATYEIRLLTDELLRESRNYYENRKENVSKARELQKQSNGLQRQLINQGARLESPELARLQERIEKVSRPTGHFRAAEVTRNGTDFIGLRELGTTREILIPTNRIQHVIGR